MARSNLLLVALLGAVALRAAVAQTYPPPARGLTSWCSISNRTTNAWACNLAVNTPTACETTDLWATDSGECAVPAAGFPVARETFPWGDTCSYRVARQPLVFQGTSNVGAFLYIFKDYSDNIYFTVELQGTPRSAGTPDGQWLYVEPSFTSGANSGLIYLWDSAPSSSVPLWQQAQLQDLMIEDRNSFKRWSCFTYRASTVNFCAPGYVLNAGACTAKAGATPAEGPSSKNLAATAGSSLFISVQVNVFKYGVSTIGSVDTGFYCGDPRANLQAATLVLPSNIQKLSDITNFDLPQSCTGQSRPPSPPLPPSPPPRPPSPTPPNPPPSPRPPPPSPRPPSPRPPSPPAPNPPAPPTRDNYASVFVYHPNRPVQFNNDDVQKVVGLLRFGLGCGIAGNSSLCLKSQPFLTVTDINNAAYPAYSMFGVKMFFDGGADGVNNPITNPTLQRSAVRDSLETLFTVLGGSTFWNQLAGSPLTGGLNLYCNAYMSLEVVLDGVYYNQTGSRNDGEGTNVGARYICPVVPGGIGGANWPNTSLPVFVPDNVVGMPGYVRLGNITSNVQNYRRRLCDYPSLAIPAMTCLAPPPSPPPSPNPPPVPPSPPPSPPSPPLPPSPPPSPSSPSPPPPSPSSDFCRVNFRVLSRSPKSGDRTAECTKMSELVNTLFTTAVIIRQPGSFVCSNTSATELSTSADLLDGTSTQQFLANMVGNVATFATFAFPPPGGLGLVCGDYFNITANCTGLNNNFNFTIFQAGGRIINVTYPVVIGPGEALSIPSTIPSYACPPPPPAPSPPPAPLPPSPPPVPPSPPMPSPPTSPSPAPPRPPPGYRFQMSVINGDTNDAITNCVRYTAWLGAIMDSFERTGSIRRTDKSAPYCGRPAQETLLNPELSTPTDVDFLYRYLSVNSTIAVFARDGGVPCNSTVRLYNPVGGIFTDFRCTRDTRVAELGVFDLCCPLPPAPPPPSPPQPSPPPPPPVSPPPPPSPPPPSPPPPAPPPPSPPPPNPPPPNPPPPSPPPPELPPSPPPPSPPPPSPPPPPPPSPPPSPPPRSPPPPAVKNPSPPPSPPPPRTPPVLSPWPPLPAKNAALPPPPPYANNSWTAPAGLEVRTYEIFAPFRNGANKNTGVTNRTVVYWLCPALKKALADQLGQPAVFKPHPQGIACSSYYTLNKGKGIFYRATVAAQADAHNSLMEFIADGGEFVRDARLVCGGQIRIGSGEAAQGKLRPIAPSPFDPKAVVSAYNWLVFKNGACFNTLL